MTEHPTDAPDWFQQYTTLARNDHWKTVAGARIHYQTWNDQEAKPGLLFVHGHAAHAHWWDFIAPAFIDKYKVAATDMSGAGDSDHRDAYSARTFAQEIFTVAQALGEDTIVVGHSLGGTMTRICGHLYGDRLGGIVIVDSNISRSRGKRTPLPMPRRKDRIYASIETGIRRFRLRPAQPSPPAYITHYIARHSLRQNNAGYSFKLDPAVFAKMNEVSVEALPDAVTMVSEMVCPAGFIYGEKSVFFPPENIKRLTSLFPQDLLTGIPDAHHHLFLQQPEKFCAALRNLLGNIRKKS